MMNTSATPAALASAAFRVLPQGAQAPCFLGEQMKKASDKSLAFQTGARRGLVFYL
jgi:hypothetical protein